ncbi:hypothetical protein GCM10025866_17250 [Naasia aerilata]|uniref:ThuA-like domain-containing protein n=1 Tax=Naasia aerilata TaxID=1162966 RepID=A0ABM8GC49_9MICO|nr:hypothetical protein GCM10025866_17250 [Naasia aerilata]
MAESSGKQALVVWGGWEGHSPREAVGLFLPFLESSGYAVRVEEGPGVYAEPGAMADVDLIVQSVTMSTITQEQFEGLEAAVRVGTGLAGWHGGIADSYRANSDYLHLVGGQFATHPSRDDVGPDDTGAARNYRRYRVELTPAAAEHPITAGLTDFELETEQYWVLSDDYNDVLATTTHPTREGRPWNRPVTSPAVWTRSWGPVGSSSRPRGTIWRPCGSPRCGRSSSAACSGRAAEAGGQGPPRPQYTAQTGLKPCRGHPLFVLWGTGRGFAGLQSVQGWTSADVVGGQHLWGSTRIPKWARHSPWPPSWWRSPSPSSPSPFPAGCAPSRAS